MIDKEQVRKEGEQFLKFGIFYRIIIMRALYNSKIAIDYNQTEETFVSTAVFYWW